MRDLKRRTLVRRVGVLAACALTVLFAAAAVGAASTMAVGRQDAACIGCHGQTVSGAHTGLDCTACHRPHSDATDRSPGLVAADVDALCARCHPDVEAGYSHPTGHGYYDRVAKTGMTCVSTCHDPHGGPYQDALRRPCGEDGCGTDGLCLGCHDRDSLP